MLIYTVGISASGKSTFCNQYIIPANPNIIYLSSDFCRSIIGIGEEDQSVSADTFRFIETATSYFLQQNKTVLIDATFTSKRSRKNIIEIARKLNQEIICYYFDVPLDVCKERNKKRSRIVPESILEKQYNNLSLPSYEDVDVLHTVNEDGKIISTAVSKEIL